MALADLPLDVLYNLATYLDTKADVLRLALSNKHLFSGLCPALYSDVHLVSMEQCLSTLRMLDNRPEIARHVRKLLVRFSTGPRAHTIHYDAYNVACLVERLAHALDALHTFIWDADEIPQREDMWLVLRTSCPQLATVGVSYGAELPDIHSNVFQFKNLRGFSLNVKGGCCGQFADADPQEFYAEPQLWDMLVRRSPDLEELHISGVPFVSSQVAHPLCHARWPKLHSLSLGDTLYDCDRRPALEQPLISFLEAHPRLRSLRISRAALDPSLLTSLTPDSLPELTHFSGAIEHLQGLAHIHHQITSVALDEPLVIRDFASSLLVSVLTRLTSLTELRVCVVFQSAHQGGSLSRSIVRACPHLTKLDIVCTPQSSFTIDTLARAVRPLALLQHLRITLVRAQDEHPLPVCAATVAHALPRLHSFSITFIPSDLTLPLYSSPEIGRTAGVPGHPYTETGNYIIQTDEHGLPISVMCTENRTSGSLLPSFGSLPAAVMKPLLLSCNPSRAKRNSYRLALRPEVRTQSGLGLVFERSQAGDQARVLVTLMSLMGLVSWGLYFS